MLTASASTYIYYDLTAPHSHDQASQPVVIRPNSTGRQIVNQLHASNIIRHQLPVLVYLTVCDYGASLQAGEYHFPSPITPVQAIHFLMKGQVSAKRVTLPEGLNRFEIAQIISKLPLSGAESALSLTEDPSLIADLDAAADSLEGYLFPDTYEYTENTTAAELITKMIARFRQVFHQDHVERAKAIGMTVGQVVALASLVETEAKVDSERQIISSVFHNRLNKGMKLDCDPTVQYAAILAGKSHQVITKSDLARESPYNTYLHSGLPPGPIASPGRSSLEAALFPAQTHYLYFVVDGSKSDGSHRFATTLAEHEANVIAYRRAQTDQRPAQ